MAFSLVVVPSIRDPRWPLFPDTVQDASQVSSDVLRPVQDASIQDVDNALSIDHNFGHSTVVDEHDDDQGIIVRKCTAKTSASENEISLLKVRGGPISTVGYLLIRALLM